ncbi:hypothetical protein [Marinigracilibium pacificum]|uniref:Uncharacterized protein n=1 Tax=Marinigracilibium pacificum TaxID=2729599 RepID=A0A848J6H6_9BACT|nr:hypothetical protein [Marinigracilibium pacificum]NMM50120.1 hypothetical protein [Marinigracilibium pacificum]
MFKIKTDRFILYVLSAICILMMAFSFLALSDIYNSSKIDLTTEWNIVRWSFILNVSLVGYYAYCFLKRQV